MVENKLGLVLQLGSLISLFSKIESNETASNRKQVTEVTWLSTSNWTIKEAMFR